MTRALECLPHKCKNLINPHKKSGMEVHPLGGVEKNRLLKLVDFHPLYLNQ